MGCLIKLIQTNLTVVKKTQAMTDLQERMEANKRKLPADVFNAIEQLDITEIPQNRIAVLLLLVEYVQQKTRSGEVVNLNFICTHNSRRSQLAQVWAHTMAVLFGVEAACFSGGVEITAFNSSAVEALESAGFKFEKVGKENPAYAMSLGISNVSLVCFSKLFDADSNPKTNFAAIMVCSDADANCPLVPGCEQRISLTYEDPKKFDGTDQEKEMYQNRSLEIAREMKYIFSLIQS